MLSLPEDIVALLAPFAPLFSRRVWRYVPVLVVGALLAPGRRMVSTALRAVGLGQTHPAGAAGGDLCARRSAGTGHGRDHRAASRGPHGRRWHLSGPGALQPR